MPQKSGNQVIIMQRCQRVAYVMVWFFVSLATIVIIGIMYGDNINLSLFYRPTNMKIFKVKLNPSVQLYSTQKDLQTGSSNGSFMSVNNDSTIPIRDVTNRPKMNKFLDGLLAYEERDPSSCLSKYESHNYRKTSPYHPSLYLTSKLRRYENLHKMCGPHSIYYKAAIAKFQTKSNNTNYDEIVSTGETCNYIVWKAVYGLGNRMLSITSAFLYAVLTNRVLLVEFNTTSMADLFCEPFPNSSWLLPTDFPIPAFGYNNDTYQTFESLLHVHRTTNNSSKSLAPLFVHVNIGSSSQIANSTKHNINNFQCDHNQEILRLIPTLIIESDQYLVPSIFMIPSFHHELSKLFPDNNIVFHLLGHYLFNPSNQAWSIITKFYQSHLAHAEERVGLQIRLFDPVHISHNKYMRQILSCTSSHSLLPTIETKVTTINASLNSKNMSSSCTAILVVSLYSIYAKNIKSMYSMSHVYDNRVTVHQPSHEEVQKYDSSQHNMKAWVDMYLLSLCDVMVTSAQSTFGYVAQSLGGLKPWILIKPTEEGIPNPPCQRAFSMEPCLHFPPKLFGKTNTKLMNITLACEDTQWGVKLNPDAN